MLIDIKLVDMSILVEGHLYQFIGEIKGNMEKVYIIILILMILLLTLSLSYIGIAK